MSNSTLVLTSLVKEVCFHCGLIFGLEKNHHEALVKSHEEFYCPVGHKQYYCSETNEERLEKQLHRERQKHDQTKADLENKEYQRRNVKGQLTKMRNRIKSGVCPCCNRTFRDLHRHMKSKHPNYK